jgi:hypothetical protein
MGMLAGASGANIWNEIGSYTIDMVISQTEQNKMQ